MAVISELIDAGMSLKEQGNHQAAIEHFRQLNVTYPNHARIMFELAGSWQAFGVPEQALPLYQRLLAMPKSQGLNPKDMPRLYTQLGATLRTLGKFSESLDIIDEGLHLFPDYRPLRAYRMFALHSAGFHQNAMIEAIELMLESLAPQKWDSYEDEIIDIVNDIRQRTPDAHTAYLEDWDFDEFWTEKGKKAREKQQRETDADDVSIDDVLEEASAIVDNDGDGHHDDDEQDEDKDPQDEDTEESPTDDPDIQTEPQAQITVEPQETDEADDDSFEVEVKIIDKSNPPKSKKPKGKQSGKKPVKIDITDENDPVDIPSEADDDDDDDQASATSGKINIPIDFD